MASGLGFCIYRHGLEFGVIAGNFKDGIMDGLFIWIRSVMWAGNCSLHKIKHKNEISTDNTIWLLKFLPRNADT